MLRQERLQTVTFRETKLEKGLALYIDSELATPCFAICGLRQQKLLRELRDIVYG